LGFFGDVEKGPPRSVFTEVTTQVVGGISVAPEHNKKLLKQLFGTRRNGRMAPFLKGVLVAVAILCGAVLVALLMVGAIGGLSQSGG
jgi:hypothetical protein